MFSDEEEDLFSDSKDSFDSIGIDLAEEKPLEDNDDTQPAGSSLEELTTRMGRLGEENEHLDRLAKELRVAVSLRKEMERCQSRRNDGGPIRCFIESRHLSTGSQLLLLNVENKSQFPLNDWILSISWNSAAILSPNSVVKSSSQAFHLPFLNVSQKRSFELFISEEFLHTRTVDPLVFRVELTRGFVISGMNSSFRLALNSAFICTLHMLSPASTPSKPMRTSYTVSIPRSLVNLLCGCPDDVTVSHVLQLLLRPSSLEHLVPDSSPCVSLSLHLSPSSQEPLSLSIRSEPRCFLVDILARDHSLRDLVSRDIKLYLLHLGAGCHFQPKGSLACLPEKESLDQFYESVIGVYK